MKLNDKLLQFSVYLIYYNEFSLFLYKIPKHIDQFLPSGHKFKYFFALTNCFLPFVSTDEEPIPLPHYRVILECWGKCIKVTGEYVE
jgi:hypothetical protein